MTTNTIANPNDATRANSRFWAVAGVFALLLHALLLAVVLPRFKQTREISTAETEQRTVEVKERLARLEEQRAARREEMRIAPEVAEQVKRMEEQKTVPKIEEQVERLEEIRRDLEVRAEEAVKRLEEQTAADRREIRKQDVVKQADRLQNRVRRILDSTSSHLVFGGYTDGANSGRKQIDDLRLYREGPSDAVLTRFRDLPSQGLAHHWPISEGEDLRLIDRVGEVDLEVPKNISLRDEADAEAFSPRRLKFMWSDSGILDAGNFAIGEGFTLTLWVRPEEDKFQVLATTMSRGGRARGFRLALEPGEILNEKGMRLSLETRSDSGTGRVDSGSVLLPYNAWTQVAMRLIPAREEAEIFINGEKVTQKVEGEPMIAADLDTTERGVDPALGDKMRELSDAVDALPTERSPDAEDVDKVADNVEALKKELDRQRDRSEHHRELDLAQRSADALNDAAETYSQQADDPEPDTTPLKELAGDGPSEPPPDSSDPAEIYDHARETEKAIEDAFTKGRAAELVANENMDVNQAIGAARAQGANRRALSESLRKNRNEPSHTVAEVDAHRDTLREIRGEIDAMVSRAEAMGRQAPSTQSQRSHSSHHAASAAARSHGQGRMMDLSALTAGAGGGAAAFGAGSGMGGEGAYRVAGEESRFDLLPSSVQVRAGEPFPILPGRRVTDEALRRSWMFVGTWYMIGPWEISARYDYDDTRHPPESRIDLSAEYFDGKFADQPGHPDQVLRWRFYQSDRSRLEPPRVYADSTWYWYTEVYSDRERPVIMGFTHDDGGRVWLNDLLIYEKKSGSSGAGVFDGISGLRRVTLKQGYNKLLVRHENGPAYAHHRVVIFSDDAVVLEE
ncbi:MAG: LamG-like jellyroll fold domain-containing protein [Kiritimatiellia bacterium]